MKTDIYGYSIDPNRVPKYQDKYGRIRRNMIGTNHVQCPTCDAFFNAVTGFTLHRVSTEGKKRCLTRSELLARGFTMSKTDYWKAPMNEKDRERLKKLWSNK